jgi:hypothetical protein
MRNRMVWSHANTYGSTHWASHYYCITYGYDTDIIIITY